MGLRHTKIKLQKVLRLPHLSDSRKMGCANGKSALTEDDLEFIATHTAVTREEVDAQYESFLRKHPDGQISRKEFSALMRQCYPNADTDKLEKHIFRMYDSNQDGFIDFREFMIVLYIMSSGSPEENLHQIFKVFDINNDGAISMRELKRIVKDLFHLLSPEDNPEQASKSAMASMAFKEMDTNSDGKVTREEFVKAIMGQEKFSSKLALKIVDVFITE
ncbi:neuronal calcium sensor 2-like isoform X2 [Tigriopus californicus]|uniref:neuronal calcium sensor 2-like isoform X2 n=1 Tax=Tigriopus californicus TaxID=6832 RepID=UPI0027DA8E10|nr:neuronal calcium sensor 2-like isoform X2 [Tigriopus californicus]